MLRSYDPAMVALARSCLAALLAMPALAQDRAAGAQGLRSGRLFHRRQADARARPSTSSLFDGQRYRFANAQHRDLFKASPDKYAPQFGGLCAMNLSRGVKRESDPHNWVISNGNLYVFAGETRAAGLRQGSPTSPPRPPPTGSAEDQATQ